LRIVVLLASDYRPRTSSFEEAEGVVLLLPLVLLVLLLWTSSFEEAEGVEQLMKTWPELGRTVV